MKEDKTYNTSIYGRIGYLVMCLPATLFSLMSALVIKEIISGTYKGSTGFAMFISALGITCSCMLLQCIFRLFQFYPRFIIKSDTLNYIGIFKKKAFDWNDIKEISICLVGGPFVYLLLFTKKRAKSYRLDVSGLKPDYKELYSDINERIIQDETYDSKWVTWTRNK